MQPVHFVAAAFALAAATAVSAQTTTYTSSAAFLPNVGAGSYTEAFAVPSFSGDATADFSSGGFSYTVSVPGNTLYGNGGFIGTNGPNFPMLVTFTGAPVTAVGGNFFATNISDVFQAVPITVTLSDGTTSMFTPASESASYRGFVSTLAITSLTLGAPGASLYVGMDNLTVGVASVVPEPATALLLGLGLGGVLLARRRRAAA
ncbi:MAG: PEP-CTERM sorting domain-containing protein [Rubrivivax sp.]|nr:PEP-CTERM sorting domain-containing protein [Rubrivivax sp.]